MPSQISLTASHPGLSSQWTWIRNVSILAVILALISALFYYLDSHLEAFYIFTPSQLHDLSLRAISSHGNDTRAVVGYIVGELNEKLSGNYVNLDEDWIFNNAGGAMGAMYIIHASEFCPKEKILEADADNGHSMVLIN
jgi:C-8 sterol isomerase